MAVATKLGVALLVALASNATLLSMLITNKNQKSTTTDTSNNDDSLVRNTDMPKSSDLLPNLLQRTRGKIGDGSDDETQRNYDGVIAESGNSLTNRNSRRKTKISHLTENRKGNNADLESEAGEGEFPPRSERSTMMKRIDTGHHLDDVIATLTDNELEELDPSIAKILIPALIGLESMVLRELERLHDVSVHQELRLEELEKRQLQGQEVMEAANIIREEQYLLQRKAQKEALSKQTSSESTEPPSPNSQEKEDAPPQKQSSIEVTDFENTNSSDSLESEDGSGSGDESFIVVSTTVTTTTTTAAAASYNESSDNAIINHIYEIYSSLTSMEHKVMELGTSLSVVSSELYRQRSTFVRLEDKVEEIRRNQRTLVMRSTMHGFKLSDLEQFKGHAEMMLRTAEGTIEQFDTKLEIFKDRVTEHQDEVMTMRNVFSRLEQTSNELRTADAYKAHDLQELKQSNQQMETRLTNLYHSLDRYIGNIRWDVKTYLDHLCANNDLQC